MHEEASNRPLRLLTKPSTKRLYGMRPILISLSSLHSGGGDMLIDLNEVGAFSSVDAAGVFSIRFGIYLPGVQATNGFEVVVRIIHQSDRFNPLVPTVNVPLAWTAGSPLGPVDCDQLRFSQSGKSFRPVENLSLPLPIVADTAGWYANTGIAMVYRSICQADGRRLARSGDLRQSSRRTVCLE